MLKLKLQYFGHLMWRAGSLEKNLMMEKTKSRRRRGNTWWDGWMASSTQWTWVWVNSGSWWWTGRLVCCDSWGRKESDVTERLNWTEFTIETEIILNYFSTNRGLPRWHNGKESTCQCRRLGFYRWVGKIPWRRERLPTPVFWPREFHRLYSP